MTYLAGKLVMTVEAGAPNNAGADTVGTRNVGRVKKANVRGKVYPYVSAQAFRRMLRDEMAANGPPPSPVTRSGKGEKQKVTTTGDPIVYADDDIFGYMKAAEGRSKSEGTTLRESVLSMGTVLSLEAVRVTTDFGVMTRGGGDPAIHEHEFYTAHLAAPFLLDTAHVGVFTTEGSGRRNYYVDGALAAHIADGGVECVKFRGLDAFRVPIERRRQRVAALLTALAELAGGAKRALHYGDRVPNLVILVPMAGGVNPLGRVIAGNDDEIGLSVRADVLTAELEAYAGEWEPPIIVGWRPGWEEVQRKDFEEGTRTLAESGALRIGHPRTVLLDLAADVRSGVHDSWFDDRPRG